MKRKRYGLGSIAGSNFKYLSLNILSLGFSVADVVTSNAIHLGNPGQEPTHFVDFLLVISSSPIFTIHSSGTGLQPFFLFAIRAASAASTPQAGTDLQQPPVLYSLSF